MKPLDTLANELLNKLYRSSSFNGMRADEVLLSMTYAPELWRTVPIIKVADERLRELLGLSDAQKYASFDDFFIKDGENMNYKLKIKSEEDELPVIDVIRKLPPEIKKMIKTVNTGLYNSFLYYGKKIKEENLN